MPARIPLPALVLLALVPVLFGIAAKAEDTPPAPTPEAERALQDLESPLERTRDEAVRRLVAGLPGTRDAVIGALAGATPAVKVYLVEVLAADGSLPAIRALLGAMNGGDEALAVRIRRVLIRAEATAGRVLEAWETDPSLRESEDGKISARTRDLEGLPLGPDLQPTFLFFHCLARPVADMLPGASQDVKQGAFTNIGIACQGNSLGHAIFLLLILCICILIIVRYVSILSAVVSRLVII